MKKMMILASLCLLLGISLHVVEMRRIAAHNWKEGLFNQWQKRASSMHRPHLLKADVGDMDETGRKFNVEDSNDESDLPPKFPRPGKRTYYPK